MANELFLIIMMYIIFGVFELHFPAEKNQTFYGRFRNSVYTLLILITGVLTTAGIFSLIHIILPFEIRQLPDRGWLVSLGVAFLYVLCIDFLFYWYHRAQHKFNTLWQLHELHHTETELNASSSMRTYWLERPIQTLIISVPVMYLIGIDKSISIILPIILTAWSFFAHANIRLRLGWFTPIICGPQLHRIHHSVSPEHHNKNYAQHFPLIDVVFGTYYHPRYDEFPKTGIHGIDPQLPIHTVMAKPFVVWFTSIKKYFK